jgi:hypothetical protein
MRLDQIFVLLQFRVETLHVRHICRHVLRQYDQRLQSWSPPSTSSIMNCKGSYKLSTFSSRPSQILVFDTAPGSWAFLNDSRIQSYIWCRRCTHYRKLPDCLNIARIVLKSDRKSGQILQSGNEGASGHLHPRICQSGGIYPDCNL